MTMAWVKRWRENIELMASAELDQGPAEMFDRRLAALERRLTEVEERQEQAERPSTNTDLH